jgi:sterol desaturase/sphingolipid hydroxylase (fatty acid hydroxylase superfamily)
MMHYFLSMGFTTLFMIFFENAIHAASHDPRAGKLYRWHKCHHKDYPYTQLETETYIDSSGWLDNMYFQYIILVQVCILCITTWDIGILFCIQTGSYSLFLEYIHRQFHLKHSWLLRYKWFRKKKQYHLLHHRRQRENFSFFISIVDRIFGTHTTPSDDNSDN